MIDMNYKQCSALLQWNHQYDIIVPRCYTAIALVELLQLHWPVHAWYVSFSISGVTRRSVPQSRFCSDMMVSTDVWWHACRHSAMLWQLGIGCSAYRVFAVNIPTQLINISLVNVFILILRNLTMVFII